MMTVCHLQLVSASVEGQNIVQLFIDKERETPVRSMAATSGPILTGTSPSTFKVISLYRIIGLNVLTG